MVKRWFFDARKCSLPQMKSLPTTAFATRDRLILLPFGMPSRRNDRNLWIHLELADGIPVKLLTLADY
jgi:hypothetical protein